jgi:hypothetical protein
MRGWIVAALAALVSTVAVAKPPSPPAPLFSSDAPIKVTIQGPMSNLIGNRSATPRPATMTVDGIAYPIMLTPRGITRLKRDVCDFPPLRVDLTQPAPPGSLFHGQHRLKLVTHCKQPSGFQQKVLLEYSAYRIYNLMTPQSFRARLANIDYLDANGRPYISRVGFFLEDFGDVAKRNGMANAHLGFRVPLQQIDPTAAGRFAVFEYMISNYDWSMRAAPQGDECCHNARLMVPAPGALALPVPYDFDFSGLVDAPYAGPPVELEGEVPSLRDRSYRGYCVHLAQAQTVAAELSRRRAEFLGLFATIPDLDARNQGRASSFIQGFFADLDSGKVFKKCVN